MTCTVFDRELFIELEGLAHGPLEPGELVPAKYDEVLRAWSGDDPTPGTILVADDSHLGSEHTLHHLQTMADPSADPVDVISSCLHAIFVFEAESGPLELRRLDINEVRLLLSRTLIANPVLMDSRILFTTFTHGVDELQLLPVAHAIAIQTHGTFPCARQGFTPEQLRAFALHPCVRRGLTRASHDEPQDHDSVPDFSPLEAAAMSLEYLPKAPRGGFLTSLAELSNIALTHGGFALIEPRDTESERAASIYQVAAAVLYDFAATGGTQAQVLRAEFLQAMNTAALKDGFGNAVSLCSPAEHGLEDCLAKRAEAGLFGLDEEDVYPAQFDAEQVKRSVTDAAQLLIELGLAANPREAAVQLFESVLGPWRLGSTDESFLTVTGHESAVAFFEALFDVDPTFDAKRPSIFDDPRVAGDDEWSIWSTLHASIQTRATMVDVLSTHTGAAVAAAPARRRSGV